VHPENNGFKNPSKIYPNPLQNQHSNQMGTIRGEIVPLNDKKQTKIEEFGDDWV
jgi:hypothetical protein